LNSLKRAYYSDAGKWNQVGNARRGLAELPTRAEREEEEEGETRIGPFPLVQPAQQQDQPELITLSHQILDTPEPNNQTVDTANSERCDPTYAPAATPTSSRAL